VRGKLFESCDLGLMVSRCRFIGVIGGDDVVFVVVLLHFVCMG
jgi:hypothetical protein